MWYLSRVAGSDVISTIGVVSAVFDVEMWGAASSQMGFGIIGQETKSADER